MPKSTKFRFRKLDHIGAAAAEEDTEYLEKCFVDTGYIHAITDCADSRSLVVGRTGTGKSALLRKIEESEERVMTVRPESLALAYISNSTILNFFDSIGVKLDIFFRLLWRHIFTVEILKKHFKIRNQNDKLTFFQKIRNNFKSDKHNQALEYLEKWGKDFWSETEYRIKEVTTKLENDLKGSLTPKLPVSSLNLSAAQKLSAEEKAEIVERAQGVVNKVQIRQLSDIIDVLHDVLADRQKRYFIFNRWARRKLG